MVGRRDFLKAACALPLLATGMANADSFPRTLWLKRGDESLYADVYTTEGYKQLAWISRDIQAGNIIGIPSPYLVRQAVWIQARLAYYGFNGPLTLTSGLRTPSTNRFTEGAALASKHLPNERMEFNAFDIELHGVPSDIVAVVALEAHDGGVGFYGMKHHVHIDDGRVRFWRKDHA